MKSGESQPKTHFGIHRRLALPPILFLAPSLLESITDGFKPDVLDWRPNPERWSVSMVIAHSAESEVSCFRLVPAGSHEQRITNLPANSAPKNQMLRGQRQWVRQRVNRRAVTLEIKTTAGRLAKEAQPSEKFQKSFPGLLKLVSRASTLSKDGVIEAAPVIVKQVETLLEYLKKSGSHPELHKALQTELEKCQGRATGGTPSPKSRDPSARNDAR